MFVILVRKFLVAMSSLMFRANVGFMLSVMLLILFGNYVLVIKHRPFMSSMERYVFLSERESVQSRIWKSTVVYRHSDFYDLITL